MFHSTEIEVVYSRMSSTESPETSLNKPEMMGGKQVQCDELWT